MSADSDRLVGDPDSLNWSSGFGVEQARGNRQSAVSSTRTKSAIGLAPQMDRLPFGVSSPNPSRVQAAPLRSPSFAPDPLWSLESVSVSLARLLDRGHELLSDHVTPLRLASHLAVVAVAGFILVLSQIDIPTWEVSLRLLPEGIQGDATTAGSRVSLFTSGPSTMSLSMHDSLQRSAIPFTIVHEEPEQEILYYTVQPGDTVLGIAQKYGLRPESVQWSNPALEQHVDLIRPGDQLAIPPVDGAVHAVTAGDTLSSLASRYSVSVNDIVDYVGNGLEDATAALTVGQSLVIPGGTRPYVQQQSITYSGAIPASAQIGSGAFVWPASGPINQAYWSGHPAVDIGGWIGAPVKAADGGYVALAASGWNSGYGNHVIIDHGNGFSTLYAHLNSIYVRTGENVSRGTQIGSLGSTGNSTGPHLHIEVRYQGVPRNPLGYLP